MKKRICHRMLALAMLVSLLISVAILALRWQYGLQELSEQTFRQAAIAQAGYLHTEDQTAALRAIGQADRSRITLIAANGSVVYDSNADISQMENHATRPEIEMARTARSGKGVRFSSTLNALTCYVALQLPNGDFLRVANTTDSLMRSMLETIPAMGMLILLIFVLSAWASSRLTEQLVRPINAIDPSNPLAIEVYDELSPLVQRLNEQNLQINLQISTLKRKQVEFDAITADMDEGLLLLDEKLTVLTCSRAARQLLNAPAAPGLPLDAFEQNHALIQKAHKAVCGESGVHIIERAGRHLRLSFSPVYVDDGVRGIVILVLDISSQYAAEQSRRMFTANVTHELKTPLTSVLGYAEIICYGLAKPEDIPGFAVRIHTEAARLLNLVDDIMKLSRLDEGRSTLNFEIFDLYALTNTVCDRLHDRAVQHQVSIAIHGKTCMIRGVPIMVDEVLSNLCDNAMKYNRPGGTVEITLVQTAEHITLRVSNTGPAIPTEAQAHIFERFYRADASRSQEIPGTGLGLSIVKHICEIHDATITVTSKPDCTVFEICWPVCLENTP